MKESMVSLLSNFTFISVAITGALSQIIKILIHRFKEKRWNFWYFFVAGGMPSTHSATVTALTLGVGLEVGLRTALFTACLAFAYIVIYDAAVIRRAAGKHAELINRIAEEVYSKHQVRVEKLKEILGHNLLEVFSGMLFGIATTLVVYYVYFIR